MKRLHTMLKKLAAALALSLLAFAPATAQEATTEAAPAAIEVKDFSLGPADAKVEVIEYASFTCPHCANFHSSVWPQLKADYIDTNKIKFTYREVYFDKYGLWAAMVARCGGEMRYFSIADMIFDQQREWAASDDATVVVENLKRIGRAAGLEDAAMDACLKDGAMAQAMVAHYQANATADNLEGTPSFKINGTMHSNMSYDEMKAIIDAELAK
jgi:protein-disulfide isomerase